MILEKYAPTCTLSVKCFCPGESKNLSGIRVTLKRQADQIEELLIDLHLRTRDVKLNFHIEIKKLKEKYKERRRKEREEKGRKSSITSVYSNDFSSQPSKTISKK
jgi:hypothetical protein